VVRVVAILFSPLNAEKRCEATGRPRMLWLILLSSPLSRFLYGIHRMGYNSGDAKGLEKTLAPKG
jgi:hypothetical protein